MMALRPKFTFSSYTVILLHALLVYFNNPPLIRPITPPANQPNPVINRTGATPIQSIFSTSTVSPLLTSSPLYHSSLLNIRKSNTSNINANKNNTSWLTVLLLLSGDLEVNPGPGVRSCRFPCGECARACTNKQDCIACDSCESWYHKKCLGMNNHVFRALAGSDCSWHCCNIKCSLPNFSSTLFDSSNSTIGSPNRYSPLRNLQNLNFSPPLSSTPRTKKPIPQRKAKHTTSPPSPSHGADGAGVGSRPPTPHTQPDPCTGGLSVPTVQPNPPNNIKCLTINFQSLNNKIPNFSNEVDDLKPDIIFGTETWLDPDRPNTDLLLAQYEIFRNDRRKTTEDMDEQTDKGHDTDNQTDNGDETTKDRGGGVMIAVHKSLSCQLISKSSSSESIFCRLNQTNKPPIILACAYRPPDADTAKCKDLCAEISLQKNKFKKSIFLLGGDLNLPDIDWETESTKGQKLRYLKETNTVYLDTMSDLMLTQIVREPTRGESTLDLFFTNHPNLITNHSVIAGLGDHHAVLTNCRLSLPRKKPHRRLIQLWNRANLEMLKIDAMALCTSFLRIFNANSNIEDMWIFIKDNLTASMDQNVPTKMTSSKCHQPWITTLTKRLIRKKQRWFKKAKKANSERVWTKYREVKRITQSACRQTHLNYVKDMVCDDDKQTGNKKLWAYIKSKRADNHGIAELRNNSDNLTQDPLQKANLLAEQFSSVFSNPEPRIPNLDQPPHGAAKRTDRASPTPQGTAKRTGPAPPPHTYKRMQGIKVSRAGVLKLMNNIKENKATGPDGIPGRLLKMCSLELVDVFTLLFQASLKQGTVPEDWKKAHIVPLFKKGDRSNPANYRPISLTSIPCKLLEHIVHSSIMNHFESFNFLTPYQHGFRNKRSCDSQLITTVHDFTTCLNRKEQTDAILLDFSKAFDKVDHEGLLHKLQHAGIQNSSLNWIKSFLLNRTQQVLVEGTTSPPKPVVSGVPQGTVLGPLFFLVYINDICSELSPGTTMRLFADDSLIYRTIKTPQDSLILQKDLNTLQKWESTWKMEFHPDKCKLLRITNKTVTKINFDYTIHNTILSLTDSAKYLGVIIDSKLKWTDHYDDTCQKANKVLALLRRNLYGCPTETKVTAYNTYVRPVLEYGCCVWDPHCQVHIEQFEKIQKRAARFATGNHVLRTGQTEVNMRRLNWKPLQERRAKTKLGTFYKARSGSFSIPMTELIASKGRTRYSSPTTYIPLQSSVDSHLFSFYPSTVRLWNNIPESARASGSSECFKSRIDGITIMAQY